jgi:hypothetical protein
LTISCHGRRGRFIEAAGIRKDSPVLNTLFYVLDCPLSYRPAQLAHRPEREWTPLDKVAHHGRAIVTMLVPSRVSRVLTAATEILPFTYSLFGASGVENASGKMGVAEVQKKGKRKGLNANRNQRCRLAVIPRRHARLWNIEPHIELGKQHGASKKDTSSRIDFFRRRSPGWHGCAGASNAEPRQWQISRKYRQRSKGMGRFRVSANHRRYRDFSNN